MLEPARTSIIWEMGKKNEKLQTPQKTNCTWHQAYTYIAPFADPAVSLLYVYAVAGMVYDYHHVRKMQGAFVY